MLMSGTTQAAAWAALNAPSEPTYSDWGRNVDDASMPIMCIITITVTDNGVTAMANPVMSEAIDDAERDGGDKKTSFGEAILHGGDPDAKD